MNPITFARIDAGYSKLEFARVMRLSRTFILRAEDGCFRNPGAKLTNFSCKQMGISITEFKKLLNQFQKDKRAKSAEDIEPIQIVNRVKSADLTPVGLLSVDISEVDLENSKIKTIYMHQAFKNWREGYWNSVTNFSSSMCVHPASASTYEDGGYEVMPILIQDALNEVHLLDKTFDPNIKWCYVKE